jgi:hypothetical protein
MKQCRQESELEILIMNREIVNVKSTNFLEVTCAGKYAEGTCSRIIHRFVRFEVFMVVTMKNGVFWDVTPCGSYKNQRFGGT